MSDMPPPPTAPNANPQCPNDPAVCRVTATSRVQEPLIEWAPIYDGRGMMTNSDPNTFVTAFSCAICSMEWESQQTAGAPPAIRMTKGAA